MVDIQVFSEAEYAFLVFQFKPILTDMVNARTQILKAPLRLFTAEKLVAMDVLNALEERRKFADFKVVALILCLIFVS